MNVSAPRIFLFCFFFVSLCACNRPDKTELPWKEIIIPTTDRLERVHFLNDTVGHLVGGIAYQNGIHLVTYDGGINWNSSSFSNIIYDFTPIGNGEVVQAGFSGLQRKINREEDWFTQGFPTINLDVPPFNAVAKSADSQLLLGGGIAFENGIILQLNENFQPVALDTFPAEISDLTYLSPTRAVAVGYGIVLHSTDGGSSWTRLPVYNDFFKSVHFPTPEIGYMIGFSGSILKSEDGGLTWSTQRDGNKLTVSNQPFRSVFFADEEKGFVVGDSGLCWITTNGGDNWEKITNLPDRHFYDVFIQNKKVYIAGDQGTLIQLELP